MNKQMQARQLIVDALHAGGGTAYVTDIMKAAMECGISEPTIRKVRANMNITAHRDGFAPGSRWFWKMRVKPNDRPIMPPMLCDSD